ncbi:MAG: phytanoyl-CoA dioxygenase family protein [Acidimicrobiia bacterium]|nr:phytanoyl-CoA dioxygenase family protein [Acidimicrobiia bacterium]MDH5238221.1 phytanoyl-CoA dioxygenase family protein [Acidimicrobiia bacterium]
MLTDQQVNYFDTFGYLALPGRFADEIDAITRAFDHVFADPDQVRMDTEGGTYVTGQRDVIPGMIERHPVLLALKSDRRILDVADALLPDGHTFLPGDGSRFRSETTWHVDATAIDMSRRNIKMALYLDPLDRNGGALRVLPGTHRLDDQFTQQVRKAVMNEATIADTIGVPGADVPCWTLETEPGDLLVWDRRIVHASYNNTTDRRVLAFGFKAA